MENKERLEKVFFGQESVGVFNENDKKWLMQMANEGDIHAACVVVEGMNSKYRGWEDEFIDEDTGETVTVNRWQLIDGSTFAPDAEEEYRLVEMIVNAKERMSDKELEMAGQLPALSMQLMLERIRRGVDEAALYIEDPVVLQDMCDKGNKWAAWQLYFKYYNGDEEHGFFIDRKRAREYYDLALKLGYELNENGWDAWEDDSDDPGEDYPQDYEYVLTGDEASLDEVKAIVNDLCRRFGTPDSEFGLYAPQRELMKKLVGSDTEYYRGNVIHMTQEEPERLVITTEANNGKPLLYALRKRFENLVVEMKEIEW